MKEVTPKKIRIQFYWVLLTFILPIIAGWILYHFHASFSLKTLNHGIFISPPLNVQDIAIGADNRGKWRVIHIDNGQCNTQCETIQNQLNQVQKALGKDSNRVRIMTMHGPYSDLEKKLQQADKKIFDTRNKIYLEDPAGNLFMYYPDHANPMDILKDLKKVLEVSQIG